MTKTRIFDVILVGAGTIWVEVTEIISQISSNLGQAIIDNPMDFLVGLSIASLGFARTARVIQKMLKK